MALQIDTGSCTAPGYARTYAYRETFDASNGGWTGSGTSSWAWGKPTSGPGAAHSGTRMWATNLAGNYGDYESGDLISPPIDLTRYAGQKPVLVWSQWLSNANDSASVEVSGDRGTTWKTVYGPTGGSMDLAWAEKVIVLSEAYAVPGFRIRLRFQSNSSATAPGWYIDDVGVTVLQVSPTPVYSETFETSNGGYAAGGTNTSWAWGTPTSGPGSAHSGTKAWATNLAGNHNEPENGTVTAPAIDLSAHAGQWLELSWWQWLQTGYIGSWNSWDTARIEVSADGLSWTSVYGPAYGNADLAWARKSTLLSPSYVSSHLQIRFGFWADGASQNLPGWYIDDISLQTASPPCEALAGGLVVGHVADAGTTNGLHGALVTGAAESDRATTIVEPLDPANGNGIFVLFSSVGGPVNVTVADADHVAKTQTVDVSIGGAASLDFTLAPASPPTITQVLPATIAASGGTPITITGTAFASGSTTVTVRGVAATGVEVTGTTSLVCTAPAGAPGLADVVVTTPVGSATAQGAVTYVAAPTITAVTPPRGHFSGGTKVTISGSSFVVGGTTVSVGGQPASEVVVTAATTLTAIVPAGPLGPSDVAVSTVGGTATSTGAFTYVETYTRYLAEGATSSFFTTMIALLNPGPTATVATLTFARTDGSTVVHTVPVPARTHVLVSPKAITGLATAEFSTRIESDQPLVVDRTMTWDASFYGAHSETAIAGPALTWYLAEGATHSGFNLFYLLQNPNAAAAQVRVRFLRPAGAPLEKTYTLPPTSRTNIWVDFEEFPGLGAALAATDVSAVLEVQNGQPIIVERAMYFDVPGQSFGAGHESAGVTAPALEWFLAEGATGGYFDLFVLVANPGDAEAQVDAEYLLPDGTTVSKRYAVPANSRFNIWVDYEEARLASTAVSTTLRSVNGVPIIVERAMWWPQGGWFEAHNSPGATTTGTRWAIADGLGSVETYLLVANTSASPADVVITLMFADGTSAQRTFGGIPAKSRFNVPVRDYFPQAAGKLFGAVVESVGPAPAQIVVERAVYWDAGGQHWAAGVNALATKLQ